MRIRTILAAAAAPAALAAVLLGTAGPSFADTGNGNSAAISAYYWQPNGHALRGPQSETQASFSNPNGLALITEKMHGQDINELTIHVQGTLDPSAVSNAYNGDSGAFARVWFNGAGGSSDQSPQGYLGQVWWAHTAVQDLTINPPVSGSGPVTFSLTVKVDASNPNVWTDWNGKDAYDNQALFAQAASHVQEMGLSFGGYSFFEDGVAGSGSITVTSITAS